MGSTSVTGVSGSGTASKPGKGNKGSEHMSLAVHRLIGPRVVMCGDLMLPNREGPQTATVYFPALVIDPPNYSADDLYCVFLQSHTGVRPFWGNFTTTSFDVTGEAGDEICWEIVKKGLWGSPGTSTIAGASTGTLNNALAHS